MNGYGNTYALFNKLTKAYNFGVHPAGEDIVIGGDGTGAIGALFTLELDGLSFEGLVQDQVGFYGYGFVTNLHVLGLFNSAFEIDDDPTVASSSDSGLSYQVEKLAEALQITGDSLD
jgi:hypothetical protein